jgi:hypothetical protein
MTHEEIDIMWQKAMRQSIEAGEVYTCYNFAKLVEQHEREACARICDEWPNGRDDIWEIGNAIRARQKLHGEFARGQA